MGLLDRRGDGASGRQRKDKDKGRLRESGGDAVQLTIDYVKQETLEPLKGLGRFLAAGIGGSFALCIGVVFLLVGVLRLLQTETGSTFTGHLSWIPYLIVVGISFALIGLAGWRIVSGPAARRLPTTTSETAPARAGEET